MGSETVLSEPIGSATSPLTTFSAAEAPSCHPPMRTKKDASFRAVVKRDLAPSRAQNFESGRVRIPKLATGVATRGREGNGNLNSVGVDRHGIPARPR